MNKKILNTETITNELQGASLFFRKADAARSPQRPASNTDSLEASTSIEPEPAEPNSGTVYLNPEPRKERKIVRSSERSIPLPHKKKRPRRVVHHSFDVFEDQIVSLHALQVEAMQAGKRKPKIGKLIQQALDRYIERKKHR